MKRNNRKRSLKATNQTWRKQLKSNAYHSTNQRGGLIIWNATFEIVLGVCAFKYKIDGAWEVGWAGEKWPGVVCSTAIWDWPGVWTVVGMCATWQADWGTIIIWGWVATDPANIVNRGLNPKVHINSRDLEKVRKERAALRSAAPRVSIL